MAQCRRGNVINDNEDPIPYLMAMVFTEREHTFLGARIVNERVAKNMSPTEVLSRAFSKHVIGGHDVLIDVRKRARGGGISVHNERNMPLVGTCRSWLWKTCPWETSL